ncbi:glutathione peroxidase [Mariniblastus fucicola]|uniref:Glutathione peroxidase n=1 Tax=Mariniblastus fucicola TaxID=980251 RepID=A0A5B9PB56_9BACT|nr:glutathione peroxidase [Mariniblastus fucicola]QEG20351.1 Hydroperoxy fatty acid reductase gpx1 [Mariniblastus fucicola]
MNSRPLILLILLAALASVDQDASAQSQEKDPDKSKTVQTQKLEKKNSDKPATALARNVNNVLLDVEMENICKEKVNFKKYEGKVVLIVNVASKCGFTGQYKPLQALHDEFHEKGLEVVAFPCNQFGKQEPAEETAIDNFCKKRFGIKFDLFAKVDVKGENQAELFKRLTQLDLKPAGKGDIYWNFEKFLIDRDGKPFARFRSNVSPDDPAIVSKVKSALGIEDGKKDEPKKADPEKKAEPKKSDAKKEVPDKSKASEASKQAKQDEKS